MIKKLKMEDINFQKCWMTFGKESVISASRLVSAPEEDLAKDARLFVMRVFIEYRKTPEYKGK